jgi:hypothetical protein
MNCPLGSRLAFLSVLRPQESAVAGEGALPVDQCPGCGVLSTCSVLPRRCVEFKVPVAALGLRWLRSDVACWRRRLSVRGSFASSHQHRTGGHRGVDRRGFASKLPRAEWQGFYVR